MEKQKNKFKFSYTGSVFAIFSIIILIGVGAAILLKPYIKQSFTATGLWVTCIGFIAFGWSWASPNPIVGWSGVGIDPHPDNENAVLTNDDSKKYALWKQPNKLKLMIAFAIFFTGELLQALGHAVDI